MRSSRMRAPSGSISEWRVPIARSRMRNGSRDSSTAPPSESVSVAGAGSSALHTALMTARTRSRIVSGAGSEAAPAAAAPRLSAAATGTSGAITAAMARV